LRRRGRVATQPRQFGGETLQLRAEGVDFSLEEDHDLTQHFRSADLIEEREAHDARVSASRHRHAKRPRSSRVA
jgi:hypothetical protein